MKKLIIVEGPDGAGKTTLCDTLEARYIGRSVPLIRVHHGSYPLEQQIWKHFFDTMLPAFKDDRDVLMDRCWLSEPIYGRVFRNGLNRIEPWQKKLLEYVAKECDVSIIVCLPPIEKCVETFERRRGKEMLDNATQLRVVYNEYMKLSVDLPESYEYDFTRNNPQGVFSYVEI